MEFLSDEKLTEILISVFLILFTNNTPVIPIPIP
jgi:hypothetical protein